MVTKAIKPRLTVLMHNQYRNAEDDPWVTFKVDAYGPFYQQGAAENFARRVSDDPELVAAVKGRGDSTPVFVITDEDAPDLRTVVEIVHLDSPLGQVKATRDRIRGWLHNSYTHIGRRRTA